MNNHALQNFLNSVLEQSAISPAKLAAQALRPMQPKGTWKSYSVCT